MSAIKITKYDRLLRDLLKITRHKNWMIVCARCKKEYPYNDSAQVHVSHFFGRANWSVRLDEENVDFHCYGCHSYFEQNPHEHREWKLFQMGEEKYWSLVRRSKAVNKRPKSWKDDWYSGTKRTIEEFKKELGKLP